MRTANEIIFKALAFVAALATVCAAEPKTIGHDGAPIAQIKESLICCPEDVVRLDGWASIDPGGDISAWIWKIDGGKTLDTSVESGELEWLAPSAPKSYLVTLQVKDNEGNLSICDTATLHVMDSPPRARVGSDTTVLVGARVRFAPTIMAHCGKPALYEWDIDADGVFEYRSRNNGNALHAFAKPGEYRARFRVTDSFGRQGGGIRTITVIAAERR